MLMRWLWLSVLFFWLSGARVVFHQSVVHQSVVHQSVVDQSVVHQVVVEYQTAAAEQVDVAKLRDQGLAAFQAGDYSAAKRAFDQAFGLAPLPSLGVWTARSRAKLGELLEADQRYGKVLDTPLPAGAEAPEGEARQHAAREREELRHRIPHLRIRLEGVNPAEVEVRVDGALVGDEFVVVKKDGPFRHAKALQVNPGTHQILVVAAEQRQDTSVSVKEGETRDVTMRFANASTLRQRKCRDQCRADCRDNNDCYVECKQRCFSKG